jgi:hypothetical protein
MNKMSHWGKSIALGAIALSALGNLEATAAPLAASTTANATQAQTQVPSSPNEWQLAQSIVGQCRAANRTIDIYAQPSVSSGTLRTLDTNERVTLAGEGSEGWIAVSSPVGGYVIARYLKLCGTTPPPPPPTSDTCRRAQIGLSVRSNPSPFSTYRGGVAAQQTVRLARPPRSEVGPQGRTWVQITAPVNGWVSSGFPEGNLSAAFPCP